jgi:glutathione synthase/RimK-type ligase-like ATP-grasp enzyme
MKKILILVDESWPRKKTFVRLLQEKTSKEKIRYSLRQFSDLFFDVGEAEVKVKIGRNYIDSYELIYFRKAGREYSSLAGTLAIYLKSRGIKFFDRIFEDLGPKTGKIAPIVKLALAGIPVPRTIYFPHPKLARHFDYLVKTLGLPFVAKDLSRQRGVGVFLIKDRKDFAKLKAKDGKNPYFFQKLIDKEHEYRLLVLGESVGVWEEKVAQKKGEFRNNVALGAKEIFFDLDALPKKLGSLAVASAKILDLQIAGVDIMQERKTGKYFLLEVNRGPGLTYDQTVSPEIAQIAKFFEHEIQNK